jgi:hypothetical protein
MSDSFKLPNCVDLYGGAMSERALRQYSRARLARTSDAHQTRV